MSRLQCTLLCVFLAISIIIPVHSKRFGGRSGSHSYPHSGGLSGSHSYQRPGGNHGYPSSGGLSGGGHGYPSSGHSGGGHGYPSSGGLSGSGSKPAGYPNSGGHPSSNHGYPASGGLSGNSRPAGHTTINNNYHYHYSPPQQIRYQPSHGPPMNYPVYHGTPPTYVYQYQNSGSKYSSLLAGLALFNLGALAGTAYGHYSHTNYKPKPGEVCKFGIRKENGDYEETRIDCQLITSFIFQSESSPNQSGNGTTITTTVSNTTTTVVNSTNEAAAPAAEPTPNFTMLSNGTLVPANESAANGTAANVTAPLDTEANKTAAGDNTMTSSVVVTSTTTNTTVSNAVDVKGPPVDVTPGMKCYVIRNSPTSNMKKTVPCGLLQTYAQQSLKRNSAVRHTTLFTLLAGILVLFVV